MLTTSAPILTLPKAASIVLSSGRQARKEDNTRDASSPIWSLKDQIKPNMHSDATPLFAVHLAEPSLLKLARGILFVCFLAKMLLYQGIQGIYYAPSHLRGHAQSNFAPHHATQTESASMESAFAPLDTQEKLVTKFPPSDSQAGFLTKSSLLRRITTAYSDRIWTSLDNVNSALQSAASVIRTAVRYAWTNRCLTSTENVIDLILIVSSK
jgi:hypothetical protein